jgi:hypothetical protein
MKSSVIGVAVAALLLITGSAGANPAGLVATLKDLRVRGQEGPGIALVFRLTYNGKRFKTLPAGTYKLVVNDQSRILQFHLMGPGVNIRTGVESKGLRRFTLRLRRGRYVYQSDPHASTFRGSFIVTGRQPPLRQAAWPLGPPGLEPGTNRL